MSEKPKAEKYWIVLRYGSAGGGGQTSIFGKIEDAKLYAQKRAMTAPGTRFVIMEAIGTVLVDAPIVAAMEPIA